MATGVTWSSLHLGTVGDIDTDESSRDAENPNLLLGTYGSSSDPLHERIVTITSDSDGDTRVDTNNLDNRGNPADPNDDNISFDLGGGPQTQKIDAGAEVDALITFRDGTTITERVSVIQDDAGNVFMLISDNQGALAEKAIDSVQITNVRRSSFDAVSQTSRDDLEFICFASGTLIATPDGERPVEDLLPGDMVLTMDRGSMPIAWIGSRQLRFPKEAARTKPYELKKGCLGHGLPRRDLVVSPQHRFVVGGLPVEALCREPEALALAKGLDGLRGVRQMKGKRSVTYHSLMLESHQIIFAEGAPVESFYPGRYALTLLDEQDSEAIRAIVPALAEDPEFGFGMPARPILRRSEVEMLVSCDALRLPERCEYIRWEEDLVAEQRSKPRLRLVS